MILLPKIRRRVPMAAPDTSLRRRSVRHPQRTRAHCAVRRLTPLTSTEGKRHEQDRAQ